MAINSKHPLFAEFIADWTTMRDTYRGERVVRSKGKLYLAPTSGMVADGMEPNQPGWLAYQAYLIRAVFHPFVKGAVETLLGVMHKQPPVIELPAAMEGLREQATVHRESLNVLLRRINEAQLTTGRIGLLLDLAAEPTTSNVLPYIATFQEDHILNWDAGAIDAPVLQTINFVALDESEWERQQNFTWKFWNKYRILMLTDPALEGQASAEGTQNTTGDPNPVLSGQATQGDAPQGNAEGTTSVGTVVDYADGMAGLVYKTATIRFDVADANFDPRTLIAPTIRGMTLDEVPFVFINSKDILPQPDDPPMIGLAKLTLAIYRGEADYRQNLFMQGQDTLVINGVDPNGTDSVRVGAGAILRLPAGADAKYIGVTPAGLAEQREALVADKEQARAMGGQLIDTSTRTPESGDALKTRVQAQTVTLNQLVLTGAYGLETILKTAAKWMGCNPDEVKVTPNMQFDETELAPTDLVALITAKNLGAPLSLETIHDIMQERGMTEDEFEDEMAKIQEETATTLGMVGRIGQPVPDPNADPSQPGGTGGKPGAAAPGRKDPSNEPSGGNLNAQSAAGGADNTPSGTGAAAPRA